MNMTLEFLRVLLPPLLEYAHELYALFQGNHALAVKEIQDRTRDIAIRRAHNDAALRKKHHPP